MFDTGDYGYIDVNGKLNYLYRDSGFIKINGHRVELREIKSCLDKYKGVEDSVIITTKDQGDIKIVCWIKKDKITPIRGSDIRDYLALHLNHYMVPHYILFIDEFPFLLSGKVDVKNLTERTANILDKNIYSSTEIKTNDCQDEVLNILRACLGHAKISLDDNYFEHGLSSMQAISLHADLSKVYPDLELYEIFENTTLNQLICPHETKAVNS